MIHILMTDSKYSKIYRKITGMIIDSKNKLKLQTFHTPVNVKYLEHPITILHHQK